MELQRNTRHAMIAGFSKKCPRCGKGPVFSGYLSVASRCSHCGLDLTPQRADDGPAYLTITVVGHLVVPITPVIYQMWSPAPWLVALALSALAALLALILLPRFKGALIGLQWAKGLNGF